ncbi:MAG: response regulator [Lachnospiraceae bacterium]|nr:response regulator [Lachnospiraceae bacterium]
MDIQMPVMDGYEAARAIRAPPDERLSDIPIIAMTANAFAEDVKKAKDAGMNAHIAKPVDVDIMVKVLKEILC